MTEVIKLTGHVWDPVTVNERAVNPGVAMEIRNGVHWDLRDTIYWGVSKMTYWVLKTEEMEHNGSVHRHDNRHN